MQILIYEIIHQTDGIVVSGVTAIGTLKGIWEAKEPPVMDTAYYVELCINNLTELSADQSVLSSPMVSAKNDDIVTFHGICEDTDEDVCYVRFDTDWLEMVDISELVSPKIKGNFISFSADCHDITIYPYTL